MKPLNQDKGNWYFFTKKFYDDIRKEKHFSIFIFFSFYIMRYND